MGLKIGNIVVGYVQTNVYFVYDEERKNAIVFDPADDGEGIYEKLKANGLNVAAIFLTHGHFDHILGVKALKKETGALVYASEDEKRVLTSEPFNCSDQIGRPYTLEADVYLSDEEVTDIDGIKIKMIKTPGHTEGSCCYYIEEADFLIAGDTLFAGSCGRTDLPTGSGGMLDRSINEKLMRFSDTVKVYPGHGESTTIGYERKHNPFCTGRY